MTEEAKTEEAKTEEAMTDETISHESVIQPFRYRPGSRLTDYPTLWTGIEHPKRHLKRAVAEFANLQEKLYADDRFALLLLFQGMDAAGKDSTIKKVTSGVNPAGFQTHSFKAPTYEHNDHNFLWRHWAAMPARGMIGLFNRSYYEEVLVVRVHPEILDGRKIPDVEVNEAFWQQRFEDFRSMESHLTANGVVVVKFFLNVSSEVQRHRLLSRLDVPEKHWKFNPRDVDERVHWDDYQFAFQDAIEHTHADHAPWYVIPADHKASMRAIVASTIVHTLSQLPIDFPAPDPEALALFDDARRILNGGDGKAD